MSKWYKITWMRILGDSFVRADNEEEAKKRALDGLDVSFDECCYDDDQINHIEKVDEDEAFELDEVHPIKNKEV